MRSSIKILATTTTLIAANPNAGNAAPSAPAASSQRATLDVSQILHQPVKDHWAVIHATNLKVGTPLTLKLQNDHLILAVGTNDLPNLDMGFSFPNRPKAGWHALKLSCTSADNTPYNATIWLKVDTHGILTAVHYTHPAGAPN
jgi:phosphatidate phosphatase APP1